MKLKYWGRSQDESVDMVKTRLKQIEHEVFCKHRYKVIDLLERALPVIQDAEDAMEDMRGMARRAGKNGVSISCELADLLKELDEETLRAVMLETFPELKEGKG